MPRKIIFICMHCLIMNNKDLSELNNSSYNAVCTGGLCSLFIPKYNCSVSENHDSSANA